MGQKILYIDPVGVEVVAEGLQFLTSHKQAGTELTMVNLPRGPEHLEYRYYEALVLVDILHLIKEAERQCFDAAVIGCFYDVGLQAAREVAERMPVVAPCEASTHLAATLGDKFSIIVGRRKWIPEMMENVVRYGMKERLASFKSVDLGVLEFHQDEEETARRFRQAGREAVERDEAEVNILGCQCPRNLVLRCHLITLLLLVNLSRNKSLLPNPYFERAMEPPSIFGFFPGLY